MIRLGTIAMICLCAGLGCSREQPEPKSFSIPLPVKEPRFRRIPVSERRLYMFDVDISAVVQDLPGVGQSAWYVNTAKPTTHRIIQIFDWHFVPYEDYAADLRSQDDFTDEAMEASYREFLDQVAQVQLEQMELLRELIKNHRVDRVFVEGLTDPDMPIFEAQIQAMRKTEAELPDIRGKRDEAIAELAQLEQDDERYQLESQLVATIDGLLEQHRIDLLRIGAAGRLYLSGELPAVEALDDAEALEASKPQIVDGELRLDIAQEEREDAQVRRMIERGPFTVAILGGGHNLTDNVKKLTNGQGECVAILTRKYIEFSAD